MSGRVKRADEWMHCDIHGKRGYFSRKAAKAAQRANHPDDSGMRPYRCDEGTGLWHIGHLPDVVKQRGLVAADVLFDDRKRRRQS